MLWCLITLWDKIIKNIFCVIKPKYTKWEQKPERMYTPHMPMSRLDTMPYGNLRFLAMQLIEIKDYLNTLPKFRQDFRGTVLRNPLTPPTGVARDNQTGCYEPEELQAICRKSILHAISHNKWVIEKSLSWVNMKEWNWSKWAISPPAKLYTHFLKPTGHTSNLWKKCLSHAFKTTDGLLSWGI